jgi:hypothetical protein
MSDVIVYQVRVIDAHGNMRIVHAYETDAAAQSAIETMRKRAPGRYAVFPVNNQSDQYWGINFTAPKPAVPIIAKPPKVASKSS